MVPSVEFCFQLMDQYRMLENIKAHSVVVAKVAELVARGLQQAGFPVSLDKTVAAALLHDIAKTACLNCNDDHAQKGMDICLHHGLDEIAAIVGEHVILKNGVPAECCSEKEIVYYADKRVLHDRVVSLDDRLDYIIERYGNDDPSRCQAIRKNFDHSRRIEEKLFARLVWRPDEVGALLNGGAASPPWRFQGENK